MTALDEDLVRAAEILDHEAQILFDSFTNRGRWVSSDDGHVKAKRDHDEYRRLAKRLRKAAGTL